jgi:hypothetical protein
MMSMGTGVSVTEALARREPTTVMDSVTLAPAGADCDCVAWAEAAGAANAIAKPCKPNNTALIEILIGMSSWLAIRNYFVFGSRERFAAKD